MGCGRTPNEGTGRRRAVAAALLALALCGCSGPSDPTPTPPGDAIQLEGGNVLVFQDDGRLVDLRGAIEAGVRRTLEVASPPLRIAGVRFQIEAGTQYAIPEIGFGGRADLATVRLGFDPESPALPGSLETELVPLAAHELHHVARLRATGFADNLLEAMVLEGLADHFSIQVARSDPPIWATALGEAQLAEWQERARRVWLGSSYDHSAWFFGNGEIPRWTGYSVGFEIVGRYLKANPDRLPSDLLGEPATSFAGP